MSHRHVRRHRLDRRRGQHPPALPVRPPEVEHCEGHVVVVTAEVAHGAIGKFPPAIPPRTRKIRRVERPHGRGPNPQVPVHRRRHRHLLREAVDDLRAVVEAVRFVELLRRRGVLQAPRAIRPDVHLPHRADDARVENLLDRAARHGGVGLVPHLRREFRILRRGFANQPRLPKIVGERFLAIDVFAVRECQIRGEHVRVLRGRDHHGVKIVRAVEDATEVGKGFRLRVTLRRGIDRDLVDVAEHGDVLVGMRARGRIGGGLLAALASRAPRHAREFTEARVGAATAGQERNVQFAVEVLAAQERRHSCDDSGRGQSSADKLAPRERTRGAFLRGRLHGGYEFTKMARFVPGVIVVTNGRDISDTFRAVASSLCPLFAPP